MGGRGGRRKLLVVWLGDVVVAVFSVSCCMLMYPGVVGCMACSGGTLGGELLTSGWVDRVQFM